VLVDVKVLGRHVEIRGRHIEDPGVVRPRRIDDCRIQRLRVVRLR
jgi:hypothetical protein